MNRVTLLTLCLLAVIVISGCASERESSNTYDYENSYDSHAGHHH